MYNYVSYVFSLTVATTLAMTLSNYYYFHKYKNKSNSETPNSEKVKIISIEGNIGSGKSTFVKILQTLFKDKVYFAPEPVGEWLELKDENDVNLLENFYLDKKRWSYSFQNYAYISRMCEIQKAKDSGHKIIITERSIQTDKNIFAKMLYDEGDLNKMEYQMYNKWFYAFNNIETVNVYLKTSVDNCNDRIKKRNRQGESSIEKDYLSKLETYHDNWLLNTESHETIILDGNENFVNDAEKQKEFIQIIEKLMC